MKENFEVVVSHAEENVLRICGVKSGVGVEHDDVEVGSDAVKAFDKLVDDLDEPPWSSAASL